MKRYHVWCSIKGLVVEDDPNGELVYYDAVAARISELEAQLAAKDEELRLNDEAGEIHHKDCCEELGDLQQQLSAAQEHNLVLARGILSVQDLINESRGVAGYHMNGDIAEWDALLDDGCMLDEYSKALHLIHKTTTDSLRELPAPPEQEADHDHQ